MHFVFGTERPPPPNSYISWFEISCAYSGNDRVEMREISDRLKPENMDHPCALMLELVNETSLS